MPGTREFSDGSAPFSARTIISPWNRDNGYFVMTNISLCSACAGTTDGVIAMNLQIRDPRARELAKRIAQRRHVSMTDAVVDALEAEYRRVSAQQSLAERLDAIADELAALAKPGGRDMTKDEVDAMWGHS